MWGWRGGHGGCVGAEMSHTPLQVSSAAVPSEGERLQRQVGANFPATGLTLSCKGERTNFHVHWLWQHG